MTEPIEPFDPGKDPRNPEAILAQLPQQERAFFLGQYQAKIDEAREPSRYRDLQAFLQLWRLRAIAVNQPGYFERLEAARNSTTEPVPIEQAIADGYGISLTEAQAYWNDKVAQAAKRHP